MIIFPFKTHGSVLWSPRKWVVHYIISTFTKFDFHSVISALISGSNMECGLPYMEDTFTVNLVPFR